MLKEHQILLGKAENEEILMNLNMLNRHGFVTGSTGTGKTVTLKVIAESLSEAGVPTFLTDIKGDLTGMIQEGNLEGIQGRLDSMGIEEYDVRRYPVHFFDVYRQRGIPVRTILQEMSPLLVSRILGLTEVQEGVMTIIYKVAEDMGLDLIDLKDLQAMTGYVGENAKELSAKYGNVSKQSTATIQRKLLQLEQQSGHLLFGMPALDIGDLFEKDNGMGYMSIVECDELFKHPMIYSAFLMWILNTLYDELPEVGDLDKPKLVLFFDEAHLLFDDASKEFIDELTRMVKLIRSKGVGIFFCTQSPSDIPSSVASQLSNRIQHALRAYTPAEIKAVKTVADSFRVNPDFDTATVITELKTGYALVSCLDEEGAPSIVQKTKILPPKSSMDAADLHDIQKEIKADSLYDVYREDEDPESAYELIDDIKEEAAQEAEKQKEAEKEAKRKEKEKERVLRKFRNKAENAALNYGIKSAKKILKAFLK